MATAPEQTTHDDAQQELSLRDTLDEAFEQHATDEVDDARRPAAPAAAPAQAETGAPAQPPGADARPRDEQGRFAPKGEQGPAAAGAPAAPAAAAAQPTQAPAPTTAADLKPPASWRPEAREKWATVDPLVRQEVYRREYEAQHLLQETAQQRQFADAFQRTVAPYEMFIREEQATPLQAVQNLMQAAATLRVGTPMVKAQLVANIIKQHGVSVETLDHLLAGMQPPQGGAAQPPQYDPRIDRFLAEQNAIKQHVLAQQDQEMRGTLTGFAQAHEFYTDVAATMADIVEVRAKQGQPIDLEKIYAQACQMHEGVTTILSQRAAAARSSGNSQAVLRARRAAASIKGDSTPHDGATVPKNDSVRAALEAAFEAAGNG